MSAYKPILCLDFDGVIHSYMSGWQGADVVADPPVPGALEFAYDALDHFDVQIFSSRSNQEGGIQAMKDWLRKHAVNLLAEGRFEGDPMLCWLDRVKYPTEKPPALLTISDRAMTFEGVWPSLETIKEFKPWNKR